jgi:RNA polymerase sigma factor (TIGR02999 family)
MRFGYTCSFDDWFAARDSLSLYTMLGPEVELKPITESVTELLRASRLDQPEAMAQVMQLVYEQLHTIAVGYLQHERKGHTLRATALVHEVYLRIVTADTDYHDRAHFLAIASMTMRQILTDYARRVSSQKRQADYQGQAHDRAADEIAIASGADPEEMLALDDALVRISRQDQRKGKLMELVYFGGLSQKEAALVLSVSIETVHRDMKIAKAWLRNELRSCREVDSPPQA